MVLRPRKPTKIDVELRRLELRYRTLHVLSYAVVGALWIVASALPLYFLRGIVKPLAGKTTKIDINIALAVTLSLSVVLNGIQYLKGTFRRSEMKRLRNEKSE